MHIVYLLEMIYIKQHKRHGRMIAFGRGQFFPQAICK